MSNAGAFNLVKGWVHFMGPKRNHTPNRLIWVYWHEVEIPEPANV